MCAALECEEKNINMKMTFCERERMKKRKQCRRTVCESKYIKLIRRSEKHAPNNFFNKSSSFKIFLNLLFSGNRDWKKICEIFLFN